MKFFIDFQEKLKNKRVLEKLPIQFSNIIDGLESDSLVIDLGANRGDISAILAAAGCRVYSFEPNGEAFCRLDRRAAHYPKIKAFNIAATTTTSIVKLHLHEDTAPRGADLTQASSLHAEKVNVSEDKYELVLGIDFTEFLVSLKEPLALLKIDIEGHEVDLINDLLDRDAIHAVDKIFVETHENKIPALKGPTESMKRRVEDLGMSHKFYWDWH